MTDVTSIEAFRNLSEQERNKFKKQQLIALILNDENHGTADLVLAIKELTTLLDTYKKEQASNSAQIVAMKVELELIKDENVKLQKSVAARLNNLEQRTRINNLEIVGLKKPSLMETDTGKTLSFLNEEIAPDLSHEEIEALHEVPSRRKDGKRVIVIHFKSRSRRDDILKMSKEKLKDFNHQLDPKERIYINEHLSPENKRLFAMAVKKKHELNFKFVWTKNGSIFMKKNESSVTHKIISDEDIDNVS